MTVHSGDYGGHAQGHAGVDESCRSSSRARRGESGSSGVRQVTTTLPRVAPLPPFSNHTGSLNHTNHSHFSTKAAFRGTPYEGGTLEFKSSRLFLQGIDRFSRVVGQPKGRRPLTHYFYGRP